MFKSIRGSRPKRNKFDLSHERKLSCNMGDLIPILCEEVVPGDGFRIDSEVFMRFAPMLAPIMHRVNVYVHYFFVPNRLLWREWEDFITGGRDGTLEPVAPYITYETMRLSPHGNYIKKGSLGDYLGLPPIEDNIQEDIRISALPFRAYQKIYSDYYRDANLTDDPFEQSYMTQSGEVIIPSHLADHCNMRKRAWEKDYFTSALPWPQRGEPVSVPISGVGDVNYLPTSRVLGSGSGSGVTAPALGAESGDLISSQTESELRIENIEDLNISGLEVDVNDLRRSNALQRWLELAARGGARYIEQIKSFFGVTSSDARLQRAEYLGGGKQNVIISEVLQTSETKEGEEEVGSTPLGEMAGHGVSVGRTNRAQKKMFEEHGFIMGIMSVLPRTAYQQGVERMWSRRDKFDYYFPQFAHLGEQPILNQEIYYDAQTPASGDEPGNYFGYTPRYAEYKFRSSKVAGDFRDQLAYWHLGRIFNEQPHLTQSFIEADPSHRIFANREETDHKLWVQIYNRVSALRPMPYFGTPRL